MILQGDCLDLMPSIEDGSVDMVLCDLPYGQTRNMWDRKLALDDLWRQYDRVLKRDGAVVLFGSGRFTAELMLSNPSAWRYNLVWRKTTPTGFLNARRQPLRAHEDICVFYRKQPTYNPQMRHAARKVSTAEHKRACRPASSYGTYKPTTYDSDKRFPTSVLDFPTDKQRSSIHPTQKPVALLEWLIRTYTNPGGTVLDNCMGSGSTGVACARSGREFIGIEIDPVYFAAASRRLEEGDV